MIRDSFIYLYRGIYTRLYDSRFLLLYLAVGQGVAVGDFRTLYSTRTVPYGYERKPYGFTVFAYLYDKAVVVRL